jgi:hypothetical protein
MNHHILATLGMVGLLGMAGTALAAEEKATTTVERLAEKAMASPEAVTGEALTMTAQVLAVDLKERELTLKDKEGNIYIIDVPPEVRRLAEIKAGDLIVAQYRQALALGLSKTDSMGGISVSRSTISADRAGRDQPPGAVVRENVQVLANIIALDRANRLVTVRGAVQTVTLKVPENIDIDQIKVGDEVLASYIQELAINIAPASSDEAQAWKN